MAKLNKMFYYTSTGEKKLNCYYTPLPKDLVAKANLEDVEVEIKREGKRIIIERKEK